MQKVKSYLSITTCEAVYITFLLQMRINCLGGV